MPRLLVCLSLAWLLTAGACRSSPGEAGGDGANKGSSEPRVVTPVVSGSSGLAGAPALPVPSASAVAGAGAAGSGDAAGASAAGAGGSGASGASGAAGAAGGTEGEACEAGMVRLGRFCVDAYEARLVVRTDGGGEEPWPHFQRPPADRRYEARSVEGAFPQGYISRVEAELACENAGKRLCSLDEWRRACRGPKGLVYGYGARRQAGACSSGKDHLLSKLYGSSGRAWKYDEHFNNPELNQLEGFLDRGGAHPQCTAGEGVYDMVGNLHEWVSDTLDDGLMDRLNAEPVERRHQPMHEGNGLFIGGFFSTTSELGPGCMYVTAAHEPSYHDYSTGFRCCKAAPGVVEKPRPKKKKKKRVESP